LGTRAGLDSPLSLPFNRVIDLHTLVLEHFSQDTSLYHSYAVQAIEATTVSSIVILTGRMQNNFEAWKDLDKGVVSALQSRHITTPKHPAFTLYVLTWDIKSDRVQCPLRECVALGIVRLVDLQRKHQIQGELEKGPISSRSWYDRHRSVISSYNSLCSDVYPARGSVLKKQPLLNTETWGDTRAVVMEPLEM
jgi:hypothetical protein